MSAKSLWFSPSLASSIILAIISCSLGWPTAGEAAASAGLGSSAKAGVTIKAAANTAVIVASAVLSIFMRQLFGGAPPHVKLGLLRDCHRLPRLPSLFL